MKKTVLVTGACINTGTAITRKFAAEGYDVVFTGRSEEKVRAEEQALRAEFPDTHFLGFALDSLVDDRTINEEGVRELFAALDEKGIFAETIVLNAADQGLGIRSFENPLTDYQRVFNVNVLWNYCMSEAAARRMKEQGGGNIVFINSNTAYRAIPDRIAYSASKGGQLGMMRAMALDWGKWNIRVNAVLPGMIRTDRWVRNPEFYAKVPSRYTPLGDVADGTDIADAVFYFAAHARNTTGAELTVDGGNTIQLYPIIPEE